MINNNLFLTLIICFLVACLSVVAVILLGHVYLLFLPLVISFIFTLMIISRIDKSIFEMTDVLLKASRGDFSGRYKARIDWEIEPLGLAINDLLENFTHLVQDFKADREELKILLDNISEALWIQNKDGNLLWTSHGFGELFSNYTPHSGQHYWEVILEPGLLDYVKEVVANPDMQIREIVINHNYYLAKGIQNTNNDTHVFILQSIDLLKQTEQMKKDFMINLAHELRTPLTAIKGFAEAVSETAGQDNLRYLNIIRNHTDRLISLVSDLQTLAGLERLPQLNLEPINLVTFLENVKALYQHSLDERGLFLVIENCDDVPHLRVDPFKFEQIFINLIDNALRYTEAGGITIHLSANEKQVGIRVCDTGKGIAPEHLPRIFERFYVADSSRNRSISGTGLGLAIVKHAVLLHQGTIEVMSEPGKGTCFSLLFPADKTGK
jgi:two-component system, OmpR family, phosphate regulon sensor histidine kinase PhoR